MRYLFIGVLGIWGSVAAQAPAFDSGHVVAEGAIRPELVSHQFSFTEGAAVDKAGNIFFTDQPNNKIWEYTLDGELVLFMDSAGRSNGMYFDPGGRLVTCADEQEQLWSIGPDRRVKVLLRDAGGHRLNGPNDLWIDAGGGIFFTDPYYQRPYWTRTKPELDGEKVYYLPRGARQPVVVATDVKKPNGIVGTTDGRTLYVSDIGDGKTYAYSIGAGGRLTGRRLFCTQGSDGMTLDERGDVYLTGNGVTVYDPAGKKIAHIPVAEQWTANLCFGGRDRKTLFITASQGVYVLRMQVKGVE
ncbi:SMP-30/gluconolactonase/LRE family protein [Puia sp.]|jgi:gluconolactonase|uniref:SMP-30/gluconolactonase/LRE family protein n=1 Tax=Puia sp. TaxID=2045100 RepID=UPI002F43019B